MASRVRVDRIFTATADITLPASASRRCRRGLCHAAGTQSDDGAASRVQITGVRKNYGGLRPLRIARFLTSQSGERVAITGIDATAAEMVVNLVTGASVPDEGEVRVFGRTPPTLRAAMSGLPRLTVRHRHRSRRDARRGDAATESGACPLRWRSIRLRRRRCRERSRRLRGVRDSHRRPWNSRSELPARGQVRSISPRAVALGPALMLIEHPDGAIPGDRRGRFRPRRRPPGEARGVTMLGAFTRSSPRVAARHSRERPLRANSSQPQANFAE